MFPPYLITRNYSNYSPLTLEHFLQFGTLHLDLALPFVVQNALIGLPVRLGVQLGQIILRPVVDVVLLARPHEGYVPLDVAIRAGTAGRLQSDSVVHFFPRGTCTFFTIPNLLLITITLPGNPLFPRFFLYWKDASQRKIDR